MTQNLPINMTLLTAAISTAPGEKRKDKELTLISISGTLRTFLFTSLLLQWMTCTSTSIHQTRCSGAHTRFVRGGSDTTVGVITDHSKKTMQKELVTGELGWLVGSRSQFPDRLVQNFFEIHGADAKTPVAGAADPAQRLPHVLQILEERRPVHEPSWG